MGAWLGRLRAATGESNGAALEGTMAKEDRGFASMERNRQREIASKGGKAAHQKGSAHEWTSEEAREAGRKGGMASHRRKEQGPDSPGDSDDAANTMPPAGSHDEMQ